MYTAFCKLFPGRFFFSANPGKINLVGSRIAIWSEDADDGYVDEKPVSTSSLLSSHVRNTHERGMSQVIVIYGCQHISSVARASS
jgi:hypothetical protein